MTNTPAMNRYSWYGKLPSAGDFLQRRFPDTLQRQWSHWFQVGLLAWQQEEQRSGERPFSKAPVWNFVVPPMLGSQMIQMGCLLPGRDSVGRHYPVCLQLSFTPAEWSSRLLGQAESWYQQLGRLGLHAVRNSYSASQLDEMLMTTSTAETLPGSSLRCCSIRQAAPVRAATVFTRLCLNKQGSYEYR